MKVINNKLDEFKDVPYSLNGEILLERTVDSSGKCSGFFTITVENFKLWKERSAAERADAGLSKYEDMFN